MKNLFLLLSDPNLLMQWSFFAFLYPKHFDTTWICLDFIIIIVSPFLSQSEKLILYIPFPAIVVVSLQKPCTKTEVGAGLELYDVMEKTCYMVVVHEIGIIFFRGMVKRRYCC
jgi:hypothetical protein